MSLLDLLKQAQGGNGLSELGRSFGLDPSMTEKLAEQLAPAISGGMKRRASAEGGLGAVLGAMKGEGRAAYFDDAQAAAAPEARSQGEDFLAQIFGQRDAAPELARAAAERTGAPAESVQNMLPALAAMLQGGLQRQAPDAEVDMAMRGAEAAGDRAGAGLGDLLGALGVGGGGAGGAAGGGLGGLIGGAMKAFGGGQALGGGASGVAGGGMSGGAGGGAGGLGPLLQMLDADGDGSPLDDILGKFMK